MRVGQLREEFFDAIAAPELLRPGNRMRPKKDTNLHNESRYTKKYPAMSKKSRARKQMVCPDCHIAPSHSS
jgi:hypothetical protein